MGPQARRHSDSLMRLRENAEVGRYDFTKNNWNHWNQKLWNYIYIYNIFGYIWKNTHPLTSITQLWVPSGYPGFWSRTIWQLLMIYHGNLLYTQAVRWRSSRLFRTVIHGDVFWPTDGKARLENIWIRSSNHHLGNTVLFFLRVNIAWNSFNEVDMASEG